MTDNLKKISLWIIYVGTALTLALPLFVDNGFFFPFVTSKAFAFRIIVEIMLLAFFFLAFTNPDFRLKRNPLVVIFSLFIFVAFVSSLIGQNFYGSFWGDMERSDGLFLLLHLLAYLIILLSVFREAKTWHKLFDISLGVAVLISFFAIAQILQLDNVLATSGSRADATFGNPSFLAGYMIFQIAIAAILFIVRRSKVARIYYAGVAVLFTWVILATQTRGAILGLLAGIVAATLILAWTKRDNKTIKYSSLGVFFMIVVVVGGLMLARSQSFVQDSEILRKMTTFSLSDRTIETRLVTWQAAWEGWKEKPLLGFGLENFNLVFDKNFPPIIYEDEGSVVWFDRAHNVIFDRGVTTGFIGLLLFLSFLFYPAYYLFRYTLRDPENRNIAIILIALSIAYFIQDLFVFETITTYISLFFILSYIGALYLPKKETSSFFSKDLFWKIVFGVYVIGLLPLLWFGTLAPASANRAVAEALRSNPNEDSLEVILERFDRAKQKGTYVQKEFRIQFAEFIVNNLGNAGPVNQAVMPIVLDVEEVLKKQIEEYPEDTKSYLLAMRYYNAMRQAVPGEEIERLDRALEMYPKLEELSPTRPPVPQEAGYTYRFLYEEYILKGKPSDAQDALEKSEQYFSQAIELNPAVVESYINLFSLYLKSQQADKAQALIQEAQERAPKFFNTQYLNRLLEVSKNNQNIEWILFFSKKIVEKNPTSVEAMIDYALSFAYLGQRQKATEIAEQLRGLGVAEEEVDQFIANVNSGFYEDESNSF
ncbi:MAG: hypothetical protein A2826_02825 [Candidatus Doudnabacteria bacterium RIFCSPHIGHO2_01_FULL_43_23]|uniref:O-antigen ligase-related domain-containing protein n=1 Tax=Candidatus Doudnabacteria bacterium RIFCSPHIGHO2_01_FULL_43_23 TaxID=1817822 RepID=A0A1F5NRR6_9BACT|nr:MAG: hypothetical protein A2826_02825 [Candidatus Doudnabacteria bacterium RIFCSPHIGHO2_01_FULL_43_23]